MAAFEKVASGIPEMDAALDHIRLGDNVVWQVGNLEEFSRFTAPYVDQAILDGRNLIYVRFADHAPFFEARPGLKIASIPVTHKFETFTVEVHNLIEHEGRDAFYVFDCLSELQTAWSCDLMMGNFFRLTCPYLFSLDTVAFFPVIRGKHSFEAIAKIRDTTQLFLDVYRDTDAACYVRPLKVWNRYSETMFMPHRYDSEEQTFRPLMDAVEVSRYYQVVNLGKAHDQTQNIDSWDRFFEETMRLYNQGTDVSENCARICEMMMSRDQKMRELIKKHFTPPDYFEIKSRMIGTGLIGGKACGMLLARKIIENKRPDLYLHMESHDSFYIGSDVFYSFLVHNDLWDIRIKQRTPEGYFAFAPEFAELLLEGTFSAEEEDHFRRLLDYYGTNPIIVRSSSILEDGFGNAFAGKYESVFCANTGTPEERLASFEQACRIVYASTMSQSALDYRLRRGLDQTDEQMSLLVQRVSGSFYGDFFMPCAAGVGYSYSPYKFIESIDQSAGMLRLVMGLGTGAVDRAMGSYPRLVSLDAPTLTTCRNTAERHQFSQRSVDVINIPADSVEHWAFERVRERLPHHLTRLLLEHDTDAERSFRDRGQHVSVFFVSCEGLVKNEKLMAMMRAVLAEIQAEYENPVDIEYTINLSAGNDFVVNLLQCRPLQVRYDTGRVEVPHGVDEARVLFSCTDSSMGLSAKIDLDTIVFIDPVKYYELPYSDKFKVATVVNRINWSLRDQGRHMMLMAPGRLGTSSPELGVPTSFADISAFEVICEVADKQAGYQPELSYGSHFFQDLVEAEIVYTAIFNNEKTLAFNPAVLQRWPNRLEALDPEDAELCEVVRVCEVGMVAHAGGASAGAGAREDTDADADEDAKASATTQGATFYYDLETKQTLCLMPA